MKKKTTLLKSLLVAVGLLAGTSAWAGDKTVVKYSFDDALSPSLTAGSRVSFDYTRTSVITSTKFLSAWNNANGDPGSSTLSLGNTDLSSETWMLSFEWAAVGGCNSKSDHTTLKAGDTNLFDLTGNSNWNTTVTITYAGSDGTKTLPVPGCDKNKRFKADTGDQLNTTAYWHHIEVTGSASGVKMTITNSSTGTAVVEDVVLSETNVNPTSLIIEPCCGGAIGIDELLLTYYVEGEVVQTPVANYTAVDGIKRTITATCDTEDATIQYSLDGTAYTDGATVEVSESGNVYFKAVKGTSESEVLTFAAEAGTEITLVAPTINRTSDTSVTISADESKLLLSPVATVYYTYGSESGSFLSSESKTLTVAADDVITAYAKATGYATSTTSERAVALWPTTLETIESTATKTSGWSENSFSEDVKTVSERNYAALLLDGAQWGTNVFLDSKGAWGLRYNGNWYIDNTENSWILMPSMKKGDIIVANVDYAASDMVNAAYSKYSYSNRHAYEVLEDGDVELAFKKINASTMDYFYGVYAYRTVENVSVEITAAGMATYVPAYALDFSATAMKAYTAKVNSKGYATLTEVAQVPAGTPVLLIGATEDIPVIASAAAVGDNDLVAGTGAAVATVDGDYTNMILNNVGGNVGFYLAADQTVAASRAYLHFDSSLAPDANAPMMLVFADAETTGIGAALVNSEVVNNEIYNLAGQRVAAPKKGLYIVGGKKVMVK